MNEKKVMNLLAGMSQHALEQEYVEMVDRANGTNKQMYKDYLRLIRQEMARREEINVE